MHSLGYRNRLTETRHIRWNWEQSSERNPDSEPFCRYHFVIVDDKDRPGILNKTISPLSQYGELIPVRSVEGKVTGTKYRYLFASFDSSVRPEMLKLHETGKLVIMDPNLRERKVGNIEDYIERVYGG